MRAAENNGPGGQGCPAGPLCVYVPAAELGPLTGVAEGSAIVGPRPCGRHGCPRPFVVSYEGDLYGAANMATLADRAVHAAGRLREGAASVSFAAVRAEDVEEVGVLYEPEAGSARIEPARDGRGDDGRARRRLARWLGIPQAALGRELKRSRAERRRSARENLVGAQATGPAGSTEGVRTDEATGEAG